ncbi:MAG: hypothetical protein KF855_07960 [Acidobacteria bacterium]|nr:hypothetical protein [Acidobacteriota bacterium]
MKFARYTFLIAGIYGSLALLPQYFLIEKVGRDNPPAVTHSEYFYGFIGVAVAFQLVFLIIASDPVRYRLLMLASVVEKFSFAIPVAILFYVSGLSLEMFGAGMVDAILGILFFISYLKTPSASDA